jgi:very-short-patch-repair endonuclease
MAPKKTADELAWDFDDPRGSEGERAFITYWKQRAYGTIRPKREYPFARPRRFRFDFAFPQIKLAVEVVGGSWMNGRHNRGDGMRQDYEKHLLATRLGWRVVYLTTQMVNDDPYNYIDQILEMALDLKSLHAA